MDKYIYLNNKLYFNDLDTILTMSKYVGRIKVDDPSQCLNMPYVHIGMPSNLLEPKVLYLMHIFMHGSLTFFLVCTKFYVYEEKFNFFIICQWDKGGSWDQYAIYPIFYDKNADDFYFIVNNSLTYFDFQYADIEGGGSFLTNHNAELEKGFELVDRYPLMTLDKAMLFPLRSCYFLTDRNWDISLNDQFELCEKENTLKPFKKIDWMVK